MAPALLWGGAGGGLELRAAEDGSARLSGRFPYDAETDLVRDQNDGPGRTAQSITQSATAFRDVGFGHHQIGDPERQAVDEQYAIRLGLARHSTFKFVRFLDSRPGRSTPRPVRFDALVHLGVMRPACCDIDGIEPASLDQPLGKRRLARPRAAKDQRHARNGRLNGLG